MKSYRDLIAWQKAIDLVEEVYCFSRSFPDDEKYGLVSQIRRAAVSIPSNIAEGHARPTGDFIRFLNIARGSLYEVETQLEIAARLRLMNETDKTNLNEMCNEVGRILNGLIRSIRGRRPGTSEDP
jgi:four helix bundle protein